MSDSTDNAFIAYLQGFAAAFWTRLRDAWDRPSEILGPCGPFPVDERSQGLYATWMPLSDIGRHTPLQRIKMTAEKGQAIADAYHQVDHAPEDPLVAASYRQLAGEIYTQYRFATEHLDITIEPYDGHGEPYDNSRSMRWDVLANRHIYVLRTDRAFGHDRNRGRMNWMEMPTDLFAGGERLLVNDLFRAVHDLFGHAFPGTTFGPSGEDRAWFVHSRMCTTLARPALTTETRGQNCWVNYGPHMRRADGALLDEGSDGWLPQVERPFAEQKNALISPRISGVELHRERSGRVRARPLPDWSPLTALPDRRQSLAAA